MLGRGPCSRKSAIEHSTHMEATGAVDGEGVWRGGGGGGGEVKDNRGRGY